ncbi:MAG TPA: hypothetical protein VEA37_03970, partial [Flavobacterium sp.]|nr:hypothetical protein [Flavobacterium sp.]
QKALKPAKLTETAIYIKYADKKTANGKKVPVTQMQGNMRRYFIADENLQQSNHELRKLGEQKIEMQGLKKIKPSEPVQAAMQLLNAPQLRAVRKYLIGGGEG